MTEHKYKSDIDKLDCSCFPDENFENRQLEAFRWVHSDFKNPNNFLPVFKINPNRLSDYDDCKQKCLGYGLSLYDNLNKAEKKLKNYIKRKPNLVKVFGNSIAQGKIEEEDGVSSVPDSSGHFTFHEDKNCNLKAKFAIIKQI